MKLPFCSPHVLYLFGSHSAALSHSLCRDNTRLCIHPKMLFYLLDMAERQMVQSYSCLVVEGECNRARGFLQMWLWLKSLVYVLWGPSDFSFTSVKHYWLQLLFPNSHHCKGDQNLRYAVETWDVSHIFMASWVAEKRLCADGVPLKWEQRFGRSELSSAHCTAWSLPSSSISDFQSTTTKEI